MARCRRGRSVIPAARIGAHNKLIQSALNPAALRSAMKEAASSNAEVADQGLRRVPDDQERRIVLVDEIPPVLRRFERNATPPVAAVGAAWATTAVATSATQAPAITAMLSVSASPPPAGLDLFYRRFERSHPRPACGSCSRHRLSAPRGTWVRVRRLARPAVRHVPDRCAAEPRSSGFRHGDPARRASLLTGAGIACLGLWLAGVTGLFDRLRVNAADNWLHLLLGLGLFALRR